jgi:C-terminal processing protease CtpA/Prc
MPEVMAHLRANLASGLAMKAREDAELAEITGLKTASLTDLLVSSDQNTKIARERNRAIIAAKNAQLPDLLRSWKTDQLSALVVKIEQTILDLNHECEVAKDKAQQSVADGASANGGTDLRRSRTDAVAAATGAGQGPTQGFLGIAMKDAEGGGGVAVQSVVSGSPAERAGLKAADIIFDMDDQPIPTVQALQSCVARTVPGSSVRFRIGRDGAVQFLTVVLGQYPEAAPRPVDALRDLSISYRERIELLKPVLSAIKDEIANRNR